MNEGLPNRHWDEVKKVRIYPTNTAESAKRNGIFEQQTQN